MPYFLFRVQPFVVPEKLAEFAAFSEASAQAKALRTGVAGPVKIKLVFAETALQAEDLLCQPRDPQPAGDE